MSARYIAVALLALGTSASGSVLAGTTEPPPVPAAGVAPAPTPAPSQPLEPTPPRVSYIHGQVSFWRPGALGWAPAMLNTPLAPGDALYTGSDGTVEIQVGPRAFVRAAVGTQIGIDNQEPDYIQLRVTAGYVGLDLRGLPAGHTVELDTPNAAFILERPGYYRADVDQDSTAFATYRGGNATMTLVGGNATRVEANQQVVVTGTDSPRVAIGATPALTAWDRWGYQRSTYLLQPASQQYVGPAVYGTEALEQYGGWRTVETYGHVWVPAGVPVGWAPYSTGRWVWDPRFGWTWLDDAPWGWAPYHYGRWVFIGGVWAWAPGPVVVRPVYAPALVVFLGSPTVIVGRPLCWAPLAWGEPVIPWWGRPGFIGRPWWGGWGGPRVVNNVVIAPTTTVNVTNITVYKNVTVTNAVVGVPAETFGHGTVKPTPVSQTQVQQLAPVPGPVAVKPVPASVVPTSGSAPAPPTAHTRAVVATRPPQQGMPTPQQQGLPASPAPTSPPAPVLVPAPKPGVTPPPTASVPPTHAPTTSPTPAPAPTAKPPAPNQGKPVATPPPSQAPPGSPSTEAPSSPAAPPTKPPTPSQGKSVATPPPSQAPSGAPSTQAPSPAPATPPAKPTPSHGQPVATPPPSPQAPSGSSKAPAPSPSPVPAAPPAKPPVSSQGQPVVTPPPQIPPGTPKAMAPPPPPSARAAPNGGTASLPHSKRPTPPPPPPAERPSRAPAPPHEPPPRN